MPKLGLGLEPLPESVPSISSGPTILNIFGSLTPASSGSDGLSINLGVRFQSSVAGFIYGLRFYKDVLSTGAHTLTLYTNAGVQLAQVVSTAETASGWQEQLFASKVAISASTTYVAVCHHLDTRYTSTGGGLTSATINGVLTGMADNPVGDRNGVYDYNASPVFPVSTFGAANYFTDVLFATS